MKIIFVVFSKPEVGLGHWYRTKALADHAKEQGHYVWFVGNRMVHGNLYYQIRENEPDDLKHVLDVVNPDLLVLDLQDRVPDYVYQLKAPHTKVVVLNGVGREDEDKADLIVIQGFSDKKQSNTVSGPEYVILRPELFNKSQKRQFSKGASIDWFVFGGAKDKMNLLSRFSSCIQESSILVATPYTDSPPVADSVHQVVHMPATIAGTEIFPLFHVAKKACIAMGMIAWELVALNKPVYAFSWSKGHLAFAQKMQEAGLLLAWNDVGLPKCGDWQEFLQKPFVPTRGIVDRKGAQRVLELMEDL